MALTHAYCLPLCTSLVVFKNWTILYFQFCKLLLSSCFISHHHYFSIVSYVFSLRLQLWFLISPDPLLFTQLSSHRMNPFKNVITPAFWCPSNLPQWMNGDLVTIIHSLPLLDFGSLIDGRGWRWPSVVPLQFCGKSLRLCWRNCWCGFTHFLP